jgi:hypothetical protein
MFPRRIYARQDRDHGPRRHLPGRDPYSLSHTASGEHRWASCSGSRWKKLRWSFAHSYRSVR